MIMSTTDTLTNPYVGPRTFDYADRKRYFGRDAEARSLLARVVSERLLLFYAQSGAGKSSLINTRLIPQLREEGFSVLPVGRVAGQLPAGGEQVDNIFLFNLMSSLDQGGGSPAQLAHLNLSDFLEHLVTDDGLAWRYDPAAAAGPAEEEATPPEVAGPAPRFALVVDQFEEIVTGHPDRWREREVFFRQLDATLQANPNLWMVLSLREDYVAALDPYAPLVFNRLRARFYMERMSVAAALDAIRKPAELGGRPFGDGVAEQLADNLRQVRVPGQEKTIAGQYVEPVQLQVVCYQLWENIKNRPAGLITETDLHEAGDVDRALTQFYNETLAVALADQAATGVSERQLRTWFDAELITQAGTRGLVHQGEDETGDLPNGVVRALQRSFLVRIEARGGDTWIELVHDRFVEPIRESNRRWSNRYASTHPVVGGATGWQDANQSPKLLLRGKKLRQALREDRAHPNELSSIEREFLEQSRKRRRQILKYRFALIALLLISAVVVFVYTGGYIWSFNRLSLSDAAPRPHYSLFGHQDRLYALSLSMLDQTPTLFSGGRDGRIIQWSLDDLSTSPQILRQDKRTSFEGVVTSISASSDGQWLAYGTGDGSVNLVRLHGATQLEGTDSIQLVAPYVAQSWYSVDEFRQRVWPSVAFDPLGKILAVDRGDGQLNIWNMDSIDSGLTKISDGVSTETLLANNATRRPLAFSKDGAVLASTTGDPSEIGLWNLLDGQPFGCSLVGHSDQVVALAFHPDGSLVSGSKDGTIRRWNPKTCEGQVIVHSRGGDLGPLAIDPAGEKLAYTENFMVGFDGKLRIGGGLIRLLDLTSLEETTEVIGNQGDWVNALVFSSDGSFLASAGLDRVIIWRLGRLSS